MTSWLGRYAWYQKGCPLNKSILVYNIIGITSIIHKPKRRHCIASILYFLSIQFQQSWNVFKKKKTLHCTSQCFSIRTQILFFNMSLKCKFYSTTAREITLKKKDYAKEAERESAYMPGSITSLVKFVKMLTYLSAPSPFLHPSSFRCPLIRAEQDGCLANKGRR